MARTVKQVLTTKRHKPPPIARAQRPALMWCLHMPAAGTV